MNQMIFSVLAVSLLAACGSSSEKKSAAPAPISNGNSLPVPVTNNPTPTPTPSPSPIPTTDDSKAFLVRLEGNWQSACYQFETATDKTIWSKKTLNFTAGLLLSQLESFTDKDCTTPKPDSKASVFQAKTPTVTDLGDGWIKIEFSCDIACAGVRSSAYKFSAEGALLEAGYKSSDKTYYTSSPVSLVKAPTAIITAPVTTAPVAIPDLPVDAYIAGLEGNWTSTCYQFTAGPVWNKKQLSFVKGVLTSSLSTYSDAACTAKTADKTPNVVKNFVVSDLVGQEGWKQTEAACVSSCTGTYKDAFKVTGEGAARQLLEAGFNKRESSFYVASPVSYSVAL